MNKEDFKEGYGHGCLDTIYVIRELFKESLTVGEHALFDKKEGWAKYNGTNLDMIMKSFDVAMENLKVVRRECF